MIFNKKPINAKLNPWEKALKEIDRLEKDQSWTKGEEKMFHSELTHIVRSYLDELFHISALELSSNEIIELITQHNKLADQTDDLREILYQGDLVKFAKVHMNENEHRKILEKVRTFISNTYPLASESEESKPFDSKEKS